MNMKNIENISKNLELIQRQYIMAQLSRQKFDIFIMN